MPGIAVVHLVRRQKDLAPFERFLASYRAHAAGVAHELVILFKGFRGERSTQGRTVRTQKSQPNKTEETDDLSTNP